MAFVAMAMFRNDERAHFAEGSGGATAGFARQYQKREWAAIAGIAFMVVGIVTSSIHRVQPPWLGFTMFSVCYLRLAR